MLFHRARLILCTVVLFIGTTTFLGADPARVGEGALLASEDPRAELFTPELVKVLSCQESKQVQNLKALDAQSALMSHIGTCSGDQCGCFSPSCGEVCTVGDRECMSQCRREQKSCAIACCT